MMIYKLPIFNWIALTWIAASALLLPCASESADPPATAPTNAANVVLPAAPARDLVIRVCSNCHAIERVVDQRRTADEWDQLIGVMIDRGAKASDEEQEHIRDYLIEHFGR